MIAISLPLAMFLKTGPCHELQHLVQPSICHHHLLWAWQPTEMREVMPVGGNTFSCLGLTCSLAWVGLHRGPVTPATCMPHPSCCRESLPACSPLSYFTLPLMHPESYSDSFSWLIWQKKDASCCWMSLCQVNDLNLPTEVSNEWEDQQQERTA